jgi:hypothetical protein
VTPVLYFALWWVLLALALFFPVSRVIWVMSVRRLQKKLRRELEETELQGQRNRARVLATLLCLGFSFLYNIQTLGLPGG